MCSKEGVYQTFKNKMPTYSKESIIEWWNYFKNLLAMMATQATGVFRIHYYCNYFIECVILDS